MANDAADGCYVSYGQCVATSNRAEAENTITDTKRGTTFDIEYVLPNRSYCNSLDSVYRTLLAQSASGTFLGVVKDATGAVAPNATITSVNEQTGFRRELTTNASGEYEAPPTFLSATTS